MNDETNVIQPPRFAEWLLAQSLQGADRDAVLGDLQEEFTTCIAPSRGIAVARWWYRQQVARSLVPLCIRAWRRASVARASVACAAAGLATGLPATLLLTLRSFVLQQVPLKTTADVSAAFAAALLAIVALSLVTGVSCALRLLRSGSGSVR
jgi:hypothetical protein